MGIMYKLLRHKQAVSMDLTLARQEQRRRTLTLDGRIVEQPCEQAELQLLDEEQFTAEQILQLCKFLAEKSKRNKSLCKRYQESARTTQQGSAAYEHEACDYGQELEPAAVAHLLPQSRLQESGARAASQVLTDKLNAAANAANVSSVYGSDMLSTTATCATSQFGQGQGKRDVLLKIRRQIFERKRQRQLAHVQQRIGVWRPW